MLLIHQIPVTKTDASTALLAEGAKRGAAGVTQRSVARDWLKSFLQAWAEDDSRLTQHKFWRLSGSVFTYMGNGMSLSRGAKTSRQQKSASNGNRLKRESYIPAPPISPGEYLKDYILFGSGITQEKLATAMDTSRFSINQIVNGKRAVTAEMALKLAYVTSTTPDLWLNLQRDVDLYVAERKLGGKLRVMKVLRAPKPDKELFEDRD